MSQRAWIAQLVEEIDPPTVSESARATVHDDGEADDRRPTLDRGFDRSERISSMVAPRSTPDNDDDNDDAPTMIGELGEETLDGQTQLAPYETEAYADPDDGGEVYSDADRYAEQDALAEDIDVESIDTPPPGRISEKRAKVDASGPRPKKRKESVWDAVEERYRTEGHWNDLVEMYLQRVEGTHDMQVKQSLFLRIGQVLNDELEDPQQALDAFVEALLLDPRDADTLSAIESIARSKGWWAELLATVRRELVNVKSKEREAALCEHAVRWAKDEMRMPARGEPFLERIRAIDPGHPVIQRRLASQHREQGDWAAQRDSLDRALLRATTDADRRTVSLALGELNEQRFGDFPRAEAHYEAALQIDPRALPALLGLERICRRQSRFVELAQVLEQQIDAAPDAPARVATLVRLADAHERHFVRPQHAVPKLEEVLQIDPRHAEALVALERCYRAMRAWPDLVRVLEMRAEVADSTTEQIAMVESIAEVLELNMTDIEAAALAWRRIWDLDPSSERALSELARLAERTQDWVAAAAYKAKLADLATSPEAAAKIHVAIGEMLAARDPKLARSHYEKAASIHPATTQAWEALEREARRAGDPRRTALFLEKRAASTESPRAKAQLFVELASLQLDLDDAASAELAYERAIRADPTNEIAAEAMLATCVRDRKWEEAQPLCDVLVNAAPREGDPARAYALLRLCTRIASELGQKDRALVAGTSAYRAQPTVETAQDLIDACVALVGDVPRLVRACGAELDAIMLAAMELSPASIAKLARVRHAQGLEDEAAALFSKALTHDAEQRDALEGLSAILIARGDWERACAFKQKLAHAVSNADEQFGLLVEAGELWAHRAKNLPMAALAFEEALALRPRDSWLLHTLLWLYGELECWEKLIETLRVLVDLHDDPSAKAKSVYAMAMVVRDHLGDLRRTVALLEEVLDLDAKRLDAFERVVRVHTETRDWVELKHAYGRMLRRLKAEGDLALKHALFFQLGLIYRDRLGDAARALDAFRAAQRIKPEGEDVRKAMIELFIVTDQLGDAVNMVRVAIKKRPLEPALYGELYSLFLRQRSFDKAWCALDAMVTLRAQLTEEQARFYTDYPPPVLDRVPGTLTPTAWRSHILHGNLDPALTAIFALVIPAVLRARIALVPFKALRESLGEPLLANGAVAHEILRAVADGSEILTMTPPSLHARKGQPVPLSLAPAKNAMFASIEACEALSSDALAFIVGKRLSEMRPELAARAACPALAELKGLLLIAVQLAEPTLDTPNTGNAAFDRALSQSITREERASLRAAINAAKAQGSPLDVIRWSQLADVSTARVGLLLAGRLEAAKRGMLGDPQLPGDLSPKDKLAELLLFSVSDEYSDLRQAIGVGVDASAKG